MQWLYKKQKNNLLGIVMSQETTPSAINFAPASQELLTLEDVLADFIESVDDNDSTIATDEIEYEWGTRAGKKLETENFILQNIVSKIGREQQDAPIVRQQELSVELKTPPHQVSGVSGTVEKLRYEVKITGARIELDIVIGVRNGERTDVVRLQLDDPIKEEELLKVFAIAQREASKSVR
jgi:hypothetical protein